MEAEQATAQAQAQAQLAAEAGARNNLWSKHGFILVSIFTSLFFCRHTRTHTHTHLHRDGAMFVLEHAACCLWQRPRPHRPFAAILRSLWQHFWLKSKRR